MYIIYAIYSKYRLYSTCYKCNHISIFKLHAFLAIVRLICSTGIFGAPCNFPSFTI